MFLRKMALLVLNLDSSPSDSYLVFLPYFTGGGTSVTGTRHPHTVHIHTNSSTGTCVLLVLPAIIYYPW